MIFAALEFPPLSHILNWKEIFTGLNKIGVIAVLAALATILVFGLATRGDPLTAPRGIRNFAETVIEFIQKNVILQTMGTDGLGWTPFLTTVFSFVFLMNISGVIPTFQMPGNARMATPLFLAIIVWIIYNVVGVKHQGLGGYLKSSLFPPGLPKPLYLLVTPIEFVSNFLVRPFSLAIRLFANLMAGHILLFTFALMTDSLLRSVPALKGVAILTIAMLIFLTAFEVLVAFLQAYIFSMLTAVYIGSSAHPEH